MEITKYNANALQIRTPQDDKVDVLPLEEIQNQLNSWIASKGNAEAQIAYYEGLLGETVKHGLKTSVEIQEEIAQEAAEQVAEPVMEVPVEEVTK